MAAYRTEPAPAIHYRDFVPQPVEAEPGDGRVMTLLKSLGKAPEYETFDAALEAANSWIREYRADVINVETVVLPNMWIEAEEGSTDTALRTSGDLSSRWHQFIRVWHRIQTTG